MECQDDASYTPSCLEPLPLVCAALSLQPRLRDPPQGDLPNDSGPGLQRYSPSIRPSRSKTCRTCSKTALMFPFGKGIWPRP